MNTLTQIGRLTKDPELQTLPSGTYVLNFSLAVQRSYKKEGQPETDFFNCCAFGKTAEYISKYATKGDRVAIQGSLQNRTYQNKEGSNVVVTEIMVNQVELLSSKPSNQPKKDELADDELDSWSSEDLDAACPFA